ncbi:MAG TPA: glycosyltransferase family 2 protein [Solirubrobacteraceae bacterium]|nr:glycosyltransferase family 2 protein [Solirubrobacteraceae bacterium]
MSGPAIAVVTVAHDSAADLERTLPALCDQLRPGDELVVVDSGSSDGSAEVARRLAPEATVVAPGANVGFARGCRVGVEASSAPLVLLLNPDCTPAPGCVDALRAAAAERPDWAAWQALVTLPDGERVNTAGNLVHYLGFGWAGRLDEPVASVPNHPHDAGFLSGAAMAIRRAAWEETGGFDERYFIYGEDLDLSLRLRLAGHGIGVVPAARVAHEYEFAKGGYKWFYLERNRWWTVLAVYPAPLLALLAPALLAFEVVLLLASWRGGWLPAKLRAQRAVVRDLPRILARRRAVQRTRRVSAARFADGLVASLDSPHLAMGRAVPGAEPLQALYWRLVRAALR